MKTEKKRPRGRPPKPDSEKFRQRMVRMPDADFDLITKAAAKADMTFSDFVRTAAIRAATVAKK